MDIKTVIMDKMNYRVQMLYVTLAILNVIIQNVYQITGNVTERYLIKKIVSLNLSFIFKRMIVVIIPMKKVVLV